MDIILIAGLWLDASVWEETAAELTSLGHHPVPVTLPGQGDGVTGVTLEDQVAAVVDAVDAADGRPVVVGHSAASGLAWLAADSRPERVGAAVLVGGFPNADGEPYSPSFPIVDGGMPFPGWEPFEGPDSADLDAPTRDRLAAGTIPVPEGVAKSTVSLHDDRRYDVPVVLVCPEYTPDQVKEWAAGGDLPELERIHHLEYVDIDSGHWPMVTQPAELARILVGVADRTT